MAETLEPGELRCDGETVTFALGAWWQKKSGTKKLRAIGPLRVSSGTAGTYSLRLAPAISLTNLSEDRLLTNLRTLAEHRRDLLVEAETTAVAQFVSNVGLQVTDLELKRAAPRLESARFKDSAYLGGGHPSLGKKRLGVLVVSREGIGLMDWGGHPDKAALNWSSVASVEVSGGEVAKSKVGAELAFGVLGGLGAKGSQGQTVLALHTHDNYVAYYQITKKHPAEVKAAITPVLRDVGVPFHEDAVQQANIEAIRGAVQKGGAGSLADELLKLSQLRDAGVLTEDEFAAQKANLLGG